MAPGMDACGLVPQLPERRSAQPGVVPQVPFHTPKDRTIEFVPSNSELAELRQAQDWSRVAAFEKSLELKAVVDEMDDWMKEVLYRWALDEPWDEISEDMGVTTNALKKRFFYHLKKIRSRMLDANKTVSAIGASRASPIWTDGAKQSALEDSSLSDKPLPKKQEEKLRKLAKELFLNEYPNPERKGCPDSQTIRAIAFGTCEASKRANCGLISPYVHPALGSMPAFGRSSSEPGVCGLCRR